MKTRTGLEKIRSLIKKWEQVSRAFKQKRTFETGLSSRVSTLNTADTLWTRWGRRFAERIDKNRDQPGIHQCGKQGERVTVTELKH